MATRDRGDGGDLVGSRVLVELADGLNFAGTVRREYYERGDRRLLVEDSRGNDRTIRTSRPSVSIERQRGGVESSSLQDLLRAADRRAGDDLDDVDGRGGSA
jgi:hypothetical protein